MSLPGLEYNTQRSQLPIPEYGRNVQRMVDHCMEMEDREQRTRAAKAIIPGVQSLVAKGFVDPKRVGITGQSWGGYQSAYLITVTNMFAAAVPNATVVNMTSAYGGIRWQSGLARTFQYEHTQSRIGGSLWQYPERYVENSPLFRLDRVTTPVLFMANDNDGAVPWYQGIEFYVAMRRLQKEAYMVVYNGDEHNPTKRANQKDMRGDHLRVGAATPFSRNEIGGCAFVKSLGCHGIMPRPCAPTDAAQTLSPSDQRHRTPTITRVCAMKVKVDKCALARRDHTIIRYPPRICEPKDDGCGS